MAPKVKTRKTIEERRAQADALQAQITEQVESLRDSDAWQQFLNFAQNFHNYSLNNLLLILSQNRSASAVAGFRKWQELNRQVRKGEKALKIFGYGEKKMTAEEIKEAETYNLPIKRNAKGDPVKIYFPMLSVFDIAQTDLIDPEAADPTTLAKKLTGDDTEGIAAAVRHYLTAQGWTVTTEHITTGANGYTTIDGSKKIVIHDQLAPAQVAKTMIHEAAHAIMHEGITQAEYIEHRGIKETEAESVAYVVAGTLGLDTSAYSVGYVAQWSDGDTELIKETAARVLKAAHQIIEAITEESPAVAA
ncbi:ArdC-like ssDNA-binding domain-containing protein [Enteractinococcus coprophilus]|uniref:Uncharacterized protein DUF955 n=1 Tax=Enteractinococcus coprophilus TaxID=1027633 RepID=A0A542ZXV6_9MICC|nr:ArdC-like ssDNA-binding domain-containing protein [Enteractinococcus coprophilus]TQL65185.1 uncharacterized protein DUF955 [Enteractinococcus coprophilus]